MKTTLFIIALISLSAVNCANTEKLSARKSKKYAALIEIDQNSLGNIVLSQLQLHLSSQGLVEDVVALIDEMVEQTNQDQTDADVAHNVYRTMCSENIPAFTAKQKHHEQMRETCAQTVENTKELKAADEASLEETIASIAELTRMINEGTDLRAKQAAAFVIQEARDQQALDALDEAIMLVNNLYASSSSASFVQIRSRIQDVTDQLKEMEHLSKFAIYGPIINSLVQVSTTAQSTSAVKQILDLLEKLRGQIAEAKADSVATEQLRKTTWTKASEDMGNQKNSALSRKGEYENNIENYRTIIKENEAGVVTHDAEQARYAGLLATQIAECENEQKTYDAQTAERDRDLEILGRLKQYMEDNVATLEGYMLDRVNE